MKTQLTICLSWLLTLNSFSQIHKSVLKDKFLKSSNLVLLSAEKITASPPCTKDTVISGFWSVSDNSWEAISKSIYSYDLHNNPILDVYWNSNAGFGWYKYAKTMRAYNSADKITSSLYQYYSFDSIWKNQTLNTFTYDNYSNLLTQLGQSWDAGSNSWDNNTLVTNIYDGNKNQIESSEKHWNNNAWVYSNKSSYTYDNSHNITTEIYQMWMTSTNSLQNTWKGTYTYDIFFNIIGYTQQVWNSQTNAWINDEKITATYNNNNLTSFLVMVWDGNSWENAEKYTFTYDASNNMLSQTSQEWDPPSMQWINREKFLMTYNAGNKMTNQTFQVWENSVWRNETIDTYNYDAKNNELYWEHQSWDINTSTMENTMNRESIYNCTTVGLNETRITQNVLLYPNPAIHSLHIETDLNYDHISIINLEGKEILKTHHARDLDISQLGNGFYFLQLTDKNNQLLSTQKLIKE
jgi:hypothetical protein